jgi:hypothetical protein
MQSWLPRSAVVALARRGFGLAADRYGRIATAVWGSWVLGGGCITPTRCWQGGLGTTSGFQCYVLFRPSSCPTERGQRVQRDGFVGVLFQLVNKYNSV